METRKIDFFEDETELIKLNSEDIEPFAAKLLGKWFVRCQQARKVKENIIAKCKVEKREMTFHEHLDSEMFYKECENMWFGLKGLTRVSIACKDAVHFSIALSNEKSKVAKYIKKYLDFDPILDKKQFGF